MFHLSRYYRCLCLIALMCCPGIGHAGEQLVIKNVLLRIVNEAEVPARESGALVELLVHEGDTVTVGQTVARIDDQQQRLQVQRAQLELAVARREFENQAPISLAAKAVEMKQQLSVEQDLKRKIAHKRAENQYKIEAATKQMNVAKNELDRVLMARKEFKDSISDSEIDSRRLTYEHADLSSRQTRFEADIEALLAESEDLAAQTSALAVEEAQLQMDDVKAKRDVAALQVKLKENQVEMAVEALDRRALRSPIEGIVVHVNRHLGEWIEPGEPCVRIVSLKTLRAEGFVAARFATQISPNAKATVIMQIPGGKDLECHGTVTFVSPEIDPVNHEVRLWIEIENENNQLRPGIHGSVVINVADR